MPGNPPSSALAAQKIPLIRPAKLSESAGFHHYFHVLWFIAGANALGQLFLVLVRHLRAELLGESGHDFVQIAYQSEVGHVKDRSRFVQIGRAHV